MPKIFLASMKKIVIILITKQTVFFSLGFLLTFKKYFIDQAITVVPIFPPPSTSPTASGNPAPLFMSMGRVYKFISYTVLYLPMAIL